MIHRTSLGTVEELAGWDSLALNVKVHVANVNIIERGVFVNIGFHPASKGPEEGLSTRKSWWEFPGLSLGVERFPS